MMNQIAETSQRISALLAGAKQYSPDGSLRRIRRQPARCSRALDDVRRQGRSRPADQEGLGVPTQPFPEILCYPGDLNQVLNHRERDPGDPVRRRHRHADHPSISGGRPRLTSTSRMVRRDRRRRPRHPGGHRGTGSSPVLHHQTVRQGTDSAWTPAWRIVVEKHHGELRVESLARRQRLIILLPLQAPGPIQTEGHPRPRTRSTCHSNPAWAGSGCGPEGGHPEQAAPDRGPELRCAVRRGSPASAWEFAEPTWPRPSGWGLGTGIGNVLDRRPPAGRRHYHRDRKGLSGKVSGGGICVSTPERQYTSNRTGPDRPSRRARRLRASVPTQSPGDRRVGAARADLGPGPQRQGTPPAPVPDTSSITARARRTRRQLGVPGARAQRQVLYPEGRWRRPRDIGLLKTARLLSGS